MDGIKALFEKFRPTNFWDTDNEKSIDDFKKVYSEADWEFYRNLRDRGSDSDPNRLVLYAGARGQFYNRQEDGKGGGDGLYILAPTPELLKKCNEEENWNDASYVILYKTANGRRILFPGDAHDDTWEHLVDNHENDIADVDVLIAPHHGRDSGADFSFLDVVNPTLTLFGNASSKHLAYDKWSNRNLQYITNNQAGTIILDPDGEDFEVFVTCEAFANAYAYNQGSSTFYSETRGGWYLLDI